MNEKRQEWYRANRDRILREKREQYKLVGPVKRDYQRKYRAANLEKVREADRERWPERKHDSAYRQKQREKAREWYLKHRDYAKARNRELMLLCTYGLTAADYEQLREKQGGVCAGMQKATGGRRQSGGRSLPRDWLGSRAIVRRMQLCAGASWG